MHGTTPRSVELDRIRPSGLLAQCSRNQEVRPWNASWSTATRLRGGECVGRIVIRHGFYGPPGVSTG